MTSTLLIPLLSFIASQATGILTGVVGTKLSAWIASHLKTGTERTIYNELVLPLIQAVAAMLQNVQPQAIAPITTDATSSTITSIQPAAAITTVTTTAAPHYND